MTTVPRSKAIAHLEDDDLFFLGIDPCKVTDEQFEEIARYISGALDTVLSDYITEAVDYVTSTEAQSTIEVPNPEFNFRTIE